MNVTVDQGHPLYMEWVWLDSTPNSPINPIPSKMTLSKNDEIKYTFILSKGLGISGVDGLTKVQCDVTNTERLESGEYSYDIKIYNDQDEIELEDHGTIVVIEKQVSKNEYATRPWDYFYPRLVDDIPDETANKRLSICHSCDFFINGICEKNFSNPSLVTSEKSAFCPIYKW